MDNSKLNSSQLNNSLNTSKKILYCNHCMTDCETPEAMREHYHSEYHKYNLSRVTSSLNPLTYEDFLKKKNHFAQLASKNNNKIAPVKVTSDSRQTNFSCDICTKTFLSNNKLGEHLVSKAHLLREEKNAEYKKSQVNKPETEVKDEKTTLDDNSICLFCNLKSGDLLENLNHMNLVHHFEIPIAKCLRDTKGFIKVLSKKLFTYHACLTCDIQNFVSVKALQNHMIDKAHVYVNDEDIEEHLYSFYSFALITKQKGQMLTKNKTFKIIKIKLKEKEEEKARKAKKLTKKSEIKEEKEDGWVTDEDEEEHKDVVPLPKDVNTKKSEKEEDVEDSDDEYEPIEMPNGELLLSSGKILGNKLYSVYYKQGVRINKYQNLAVNRGALTNKRTLLKKKRTNLSEDRSKLGYKTNIYKHSNSFKTRCQITT